MAVENISIYPSKITLSEMNNNLIINSKFTITDVTVIRKVFTMLVKYLSLQILNLCLMFIKYKEID